MTLELGRYVERTANPEAIPESSHQLLAWIPRDAVLVAELLAPLLVVPASMLVTRRLDLIVVLFGVVLFAVLASWSLDSRAGRRG